MLIPFGKKLDAAFRSDGSAWGKIGGGAFVVTFVVAWGILESDIQANQQGRAGVSWPTSIYLATLGASALLGASVGLGLVLKDSVMRRVGRGERVPPVLKLALGSGAWSLGFWFAALMSLAFLITMATL